MVCHSFAASTGLLASRWLHAYESCPQIIEEIVVQKDTYTIFLGSSSESKGIAREIERYMHSLDHRVDAWYHCGSWAPGGATLESLESRLHQSDFAVLVLSEDDLVQSRGSQPKSAPRDNVIFELGFFMGRLGRDRAFFLYPKSGDFKIPSDLLGIAAFPFEIDDRDNLERVISPICTSIDQAIRKIAKGDRHEEMKQKREVKYDIAFPKDNGRTSRRKALLSYSEIVVFKFFVRIENDDSITNFRVYYDKPINLKKAGWTPSEDENFMYYWATPNQVTHMKLKGCLLPLESIHPKQGEYIIKLVAFSDNSREYDFTIEVVVN